MIQQKGSRQNGKIIRQLAHSFKKKIEWKVMEKTTYKYCIILMTGLLLFYCNNESKQLKVTQNIKVSEPFQYVRIYSDSTGESHFKDEEISFRLIDFAPPAPPISVSDIFNTSGEAYIISSPPGWYGDWHPAPCRQLIFGLTGIKLEVKVSDGETRVFGPGCFVLVEDTFGKGHISRVLGNERGYMVVVPLEDK